MRFVVEIVAETDASIDTRSAYKVFAEFEDAAEYYKQANCVRDRGTPTGPRSTFEVVDVLIFKCRADDDEPAIEEVKAGKAYEINRASLGDPPPT